MAQENIQEKDKIEAEINRQLENELHRELKDGTTHIFHPDAPPEEKAKQVGSGSAHIGLKQAPAAIGVSSDITLDQKPDKEYETTSSTLPGEFPEKLKPTSKMPEWAARIGWQSVVETDVADNEHDIFGEYLGELYYGNLWVNAAVVFISIFATWIFTSLGGGLGWVIIICAFV
ncbi:22627_t:CDS:1, partial [Gigaspora rosea]